MEDYQNGTPVLPTTGLPTASLPTAANTRAEAHDFTAKDAVKDDGELYTDFLIAELGRSLEDGTFIEMPGVFIKDGELVDELGINITTNDDMLRDQFKSIVKYGKSAANDGTSGSEPEFTAKDWQSVMSPPIQSQFPGPRPQLESFARPPLGSNAPPPTSFGGPSSGVNNFNGLPAGYNVLLHGFCGPPALRPPHFIAPRQGGGTQINLRSSQVDATIPNFTFESPNPDPPPGGFLRPNDLLKPHWDWIAPQTRIALNNQVISIWSWVYTHRAREALHAIAQKVRTAERKKNINMWLPQVYTCLLAKQNAAPGSMEYVKASRYWEAFQAALEPEERTNVIVFLQQKLERAKANSEEKAMQVELDAAFVANFGGTAGFGYE